MPTVYVEKPGSGLPGRVLYNDDHCPFRFSVPVMRSENVAFRSAVPMLRDAVSKAVSHPGRFSVVAWAFVNGVYVDTLGFLCFHKRSFWFRPLADVSPSDFPSTEARTVACYLSRYLQDDGGSFFAKGAWLSVPLGRNETGDAQCVERVSQALFAALFPGKNVSMEHLFSIGAEL